ncbi:Protein farnesyltransferase/geranylgeranyltransferase type-1 subunit alpha [Chionoecetes opilio]|uniref:Protein farnesyltransferase/geranylgeranyltransferase type-1 subunit alpha n=1 Tax=Chionoecetes opilio TaxID=41210 RepID=A0A8J4Y9U5_CHIOP|nr:Protein farnesyltransferase/geranylgeranyltransferase type-1 subunit alpha [Chionoecetes opilio]
MGLISEALELVYRLGDITDHSRHRRRWAPPPRPRDTPRQAPAEDQDDGQDGSSDGEAWVLYRDRKEWADVPPVPQDDGPNAVVKDCLHGWLRKILKNLASNLEQELNFCREMIEMNPKNYQAPPPCYSGVAGRRHKELRLTEIIFSQDAKNYHAWEHRQWALRTFKLFEGELDYVDRLLEEDVRNNSAWNQRHFAITQTTGFTAEVIQREVGYTKAAIAKVADNESPWSYLRG